MTQALIDLLSEVSHRFRQRLQTAVHDAAIGLTPFEAKVLVTAARLPGSSQQAIAARMECDKAQLARAVKTLETRQLLARTPSASDWRAWDLTLTPEGMTIFADLQARRAAIAEQCFALVDEKEREALATILQKMAGGLSTTD